MNACPNCGRSTQPGAAVCECGELLRADVTNVGSGWETETMFPAARTINSYRIAAIATVLVIASTILALTWPQLQSRLLGTNDPSTNVGNTSAVSQNPSQSDIVTNEDMIQPDALIGAESPEGAFDFSSGEPRPETSTRAGLSMAGRTSGVSKQSEAEISGGPNPLDAQLLTDNPQPSKNANTNPDCKPEITLDLKRPATLTDIADTKPATKSPDAKTYTLGPRGGCFYVTASGSKKYVDRSMCGSTSVAAARQ